MAIINPGPAPQMPQFDPAKRSPNTGVNGGANTGAAPTSNNWTFSGQPNGGQGFGYGWDFGAHQGQTFDWNNPAHGAKYAFADYIGKNGLNTNTADANSIAAALNQKYGSNVFQAQGNQRIGYGDEFVDWSGQGKPRGEFFWGSHPAQAQSYGSQGGGMDWSGLLQMFAQMQQPQAQASAQPNLAGLAQALASMQQPTGPTFNGGHSGTAQSQQQYSQLVQDAIKKAFGG